MAISLGLGAVVLGWILAVWAARPSTPEKPEITGYYTRGEMWVNSSAWVLAMKRAKETES